MLYPSIEPYETGFLERSMHHIYYEISGNPNGVPVVLIHGGPGSGTMPFQRQFFDPKKFKIILTDQRGCGKSTPHACLKDNTTPHLVGDLHALKEHLNVDKWHVFGGSWGSTLALAYADKHPDDFLSMVVYGIFLCRKQELFDLYFEGGVASRVFADKFEEFIAQLPQEKRINPIQGYYGIFTQADDEKVKDALKAWKKWEVSISRLEMPEEEIDLTDADKTKAFSLIENHYFMNQGFLDAEGLLSRIGAKTSDIPVHIIQGRYDMVCPFKTAYELHKAIPHSQLHVVAKAGHSAKEVDTTAKVVEILNKI